MYDSRYCFFSETTHTEDLYYRLYCLKSAKFCHAPWHKIKDEIRRQKSNIINPEILESTFIFLQPTDLFENRLQVHVEPVAVTEQLQEVARAQRTTCVVDEFTGRGESVRKDFELLPLREEEKNVDDLQQLIT